MYFEFKLMDLFLPNSIIGFVLLTYRKKNLSQKITTANLQKFAEQPSALQIDVQNMIINLTCLWI